jgi:hypothetical protein
MHALATSLLAVEWSPTIRGWLIVIISVTVFCGSVYLLLGTNLGARLGFLVAAAGLMGWMMLMGLIWMIYGIGLKGKDPTWKPKDIMVGREQLAESKYAVARNAAIPDNVTPGKKVDGWTRLKDDDGGRGQAIAAADEIIQIESKVLKAGEYDPVAVYDLGGGERYPKYTKSKVSIAGRNFGDWHFDYIAFLHKPHYVLVQVQPVIKQATEPGKAPPKVIRDDKAPSYFVLMERDLGNKRRPAFLITLGSTILFALFAITLHKREEHLVRNRTELPATVA